MAIMRALVAGERDCTKLAARKDGRIQASSAALAAALTGDYRRELVFILAPELQLDDTFQTPIAACDAQIEPCLSQFPDPVERAQAPLPPAQRRGKKAPGNAPNCDLRLFLYRINGVDFTQIDGFGVLTVLTLLSELGLDVSRFPSFKHFASWLG
jgi:transposase